MMERDDEHFELDDEFLAGLEQRALGECAVEQPDEDEFAVVGGDRARGFPQRGLVCAQCFRLRESCYRRSQYTLQRTTACDDLPPVLMFLSETFFIHKKSRANPALSYCFVPGRDAYFFISTRRFLA